MALATDHCFRTVGLHRIEIAIRPENAGSLRVVEKLGFREEGTRVSLPAHRRRLARPPVFALTAEEVPEGLLARWKATRRETPGTGA